MTTGIEVLTEQEAEDRHYSMLYDGQGREIERRAVRMSQEINPDGGGDCSYYAVANLCMLCGLAPPAIDAMKRACPPHPEDGGLGLADASILLTEMGFPGLVSFGSLPICETWQSFLPLALASDRRFILGYQAISPLTRKQCEAIGDSDFEGMSHAQIHTIVPFATNDYGVKVITSWADQVISLLYWGLYPTLPVHAWRAREDMDFRSRRGLLRDFVMIELL